VQGFREFLASRKLGFIAVGLLFRPCIEADSFFLIFTKLPCLQLSKILQGKFCHSNIAHNRLGDYETRRKSINGAYT
jgi:hypothetical protein